MNARGRVMAPCQFSFLWLVIYQIRGRLAATSADYQQGRLRFSSVNPNTRQAQDGIAQSPKSVT